MDYDGSVFYYFLPVIKCRLWKLKINYLKFLVFTCSTNTCSTNIALIICSAIQLLQNWYSPFRSQSTPLFTSTPFPSSAFNLSSTSTFHLALHLLPSTSFPKHFSVQFFFFFANCQLTVLISDRVLTFLFLYYLRLDIYLNNLLPICYYLLVMVCCWPS